MIQPKMYMFVEDGRVYGPFTEAELQTLEARDFNVRFDATSATVLVRLPGESEITRVGIESLRAKAVEILRVIVEFPRRAVALPILDLLDICLNEKKDLNKLVQMIRNCFKVAGLPTELIDSRDNLPECISPTGSGYIAAEGLTWQLIRLANDQELERPTVWPE